MPNQVYQCTLIVGEFLLILIAESAAQRKINNIKLVFSFNINLFIEIGVINRDFNDDLNAIAQDLLNLVQGSK